ncbi:MAG: hypothetical protein ACFFED_13745 [Candidatus Thorarchaeota archaeon]
MNESDDWTEEELGQNISCVFCAVVPILMFVSLYLIVFFHLSWYEGVILFLSPLLFGLLVLYFYNRKAFWSVLDSVTR